MIIFKKLAEKRFAKEKLYFRNTAKFHEVQNAKIIELSKEVDSTEYTFDKMFDKMAQLDEDRYYLKLELSKTEKRFRKFAAKIPQYLEIIPAEEIQELVSHAETSLFLGYSTIALIAGIMDNIGKERKVALSEVAIDKE